MQQIEKTAIEKSIKAYFYFLLYFTNSISCIDWRYVTTTKQSSSTKE